MMKTIQFKLERVKIFTPLVLSRICAIFSQYAEVCAEMRRLYFNAENKLEFMFYNQFRIYKISKQVICCNRKLW